MNKMNRTFNKRLATVASSVCLVALLAACGTALRVGGAPQTSVTRCIDAASHEFKVPAASIVADYGSTPRDGIYNINLKVGPQARNAVCTVTENGEVTGLVFKRPE